MILPKCIKNHRFKSIIYQYTPILVCDLMLSTLRLDVKRRPIYPYIGRSFDAFDRTEALLLWI
jgi:hypothetical protein